MGFRQDPQLILNTTPELSQATQKIWFVSIRWNSNMTIVGGSSSFTNMSLSKKSWIRGLHLPVTWNPAAQKPKPASPEASDCITTESCSSSQNQIGDGLYVFLLSVSSHHFSSLRSALVMCVILVFLSVAFCKMSLLHLPWCMTLHNQPSEPFSEARSFVKHSPDFNMSSNLWMLYSFCSSSMLRVPATVSITIPANETCVEGCCPLLWVGKPSVFITSSDFDSCSEKWALPSFLGPWNRKSSISTPATLMKFSCSILANSEEKQLAHAGSCLCPNIHVTCCRNLACPLLTLLLFSFADLAYVLGSWKHCSRRRSSPAGSRLKKPVISLVAKKSPREIIPHTACSPRYLSFQSAKISFPPEVMSSASLGWYSVPNFLNRHIQLLPFVYR